MIAFIDTNVLLYLNDVGSDKSTAATNLIALGGCISVQVLNEYCAVARRRGKQSWQSLGKACDDFGELLTVCDLTWEGQVLARSYAARFGYSIYDSNILASAKLAGCDVVWSEDMQHGQEIDGLRILNPFANNP
jgi:predicted nucleic acid-binding protein